MPRERDTAGSSNPTSTAGMSMPVGGLNKDHELQSITPSGEKNNPLGGYPHARNAVNKSTAGVNDALTNEAGTLKLDNFNKSILGTVYINNYTWVVFSGNLSTSEIGFFDESTGKYTILITDPGLAFDEGSVITGVTRRNWDNTWSVYWSDGGVNPDRVLNLDQPEYKTTKSVVNGCVIESVVTPRVLDLERIRLQLLHSPPITDLTVSTNGGSLPPGSYQVCISYTIKGQIATHYSLPSAIQSVYTPGTLHTGGLVFNLLNPDTRFAEYELVLIMFNNGQLQARRLGLYSTQQTTVNINSVPGESEVVGLNTLVIQQPVYTHSDKIFSVGEYLLRSGVRKNPDINYQYLANQIKSTWQSVLYPADYYYKGGNKLGYMRGERYAFYIRWVYDTGDRSASYIIPGRPSTGYDTQTLEDNQPRWKSVNTASVTKKYADVEKLINGLTELTSHQSKIEQILIAGTQLLNIGNLLQTAQSNGSIPVRRPTSGFTVKPGALQDYLDNNNTVPVKASDLNFDNILSGLPPNFFDDVLGGNSVNNILLPDSGMLLAEGEMGYYESAERYPDNNPEVWGELCGKNILLHQFPDCNTDPSTHTFVPGGNNIILLGVKFDNIPHPLDANGRPLENVVGYEILRASREGHKSVIAKGIFNNMREYVIPTEAQNASTPKHYYQNYPYNDLGDDEYFTTNNKLLNGLGGDDRTEPLKLYSKSNFTFHSPETTFAKPIIPSGSIVRLETELSGIAKGSFEYVDKHPRMKFVTGFANTIGDVLSVVSGVASVVSEREITMTGTEDLPLSVQIGGKSGGFKWYDLLTFGVTAIVREVVTVVANITAATATAFMVKEQISRLMLTVIPYQQFGLQYNSHGYYNNYRNLAPGNLKPVKVDTAVYITDQVHQFGPSATVNNFLRSDTVAVKLNTDLQDPQQVDNSRVLITDPVSPQSIATKFNTRISVLYGGIYQSLTAQYGKLDSVAQIPLPGGYMSLENTTPEEKSSMRYESDILFGGDVYLNRYTEKNTQYFFNNWLDDKVPEKNLDFDYRSYMNIPNTRYWVDAQPQGLGLFERATNIRHLNRLSNSDGGLMYVRNAFFYLFNSGVRDFFVESEINLAHRSTAGDISTQHYDPELFTDVNTLFKSNNIRATNKFIYDFSLSASKLATGMFSWGSLLPRDFDPNLRGYTESYYPRRVIYSLPQQGESKQDHWRQFLANNYKDMPGPVTSIKSLDKSGALILLEHNEPMEFIGADQLQTKGGVKLTVGDGGLFSQPLREVSSADNEFLHGSCQSVRGVINTPYGLYYISQKTGCVNQYTGQQIRDISQGTGMQQWLRVNLPSVLLKHFPDYVLKDNNTKGVGCQLSYDNITGLLYITKRDYEPQSSDILHDTLGFYILLPGTALKFYIDITNPAYFTPCGWTLSYDPAQQDFVSFHDYQPDYLLSTSNNMVAFTKQAIWKHNSDKQHFCNYYNTNYPFEVEMHIPSQVGVSTVRNIEYNLEAFSYESNALNAPVYLELDKGFDECIVYNREQNSGVLNLINRPKNNPMGMLNYPKINAGSIDILQSQEEGHFRFNQFWDITRDRGEFTSNKFTYWRRPLNGWSRILNPQALNYNKEITERKKIRGMQSVVLLRKNVSNNIQYVLKLLQNRQQVSVR